MKKTLITILIALALIPNVTFGASIGWDLTSGILQPVTAGLQALLKFAFFQTTSTTVAGPIKLSSLPSQACLGTDASGNVQTGTCSGGSATTTPGGSNAQLQFNNGGVFGGTSTPSVTAINATNSSATSTFFGNIQVGGNTLLKNSYNGLATFINGLVGSTGTTTLYASSYGAVCDNSTDDSNAINNAITAASNAGGGIVMLCTGTEYINGRIIPKNNVTLSGQGLGVTTLRGNRGFDYLIYYNSTSTQLQKFVIKDMTIDMNNVANSSGIQLSNVRDNVVQNVRITNVPTGGWNLVLGSPISSTTTMYNQDNTISDVIFDNHSGTLEQLLVYNASGTNIVRPIFRNNASGAGVQVAFGLWQWTENTTITDAKFYNNADVCFYYSITTNNTRLINPSFYGCGTAIQGSNISDNGTFGYTRANGLQIINPVIIGNINNQGIGIQLGAVENVSIVNPTITNMQTGIRIGGGNNAATSTSAINWTITNPIIYNNNSSADFHVLHPGMYIENPSNIPLYGTINGGKFYDNASSNQRYPIVLNGANTFDYLSIIGNRLSAATTTGGVSIFLNSDATVGSSTLIKDNTDYSGSNPAQKSAIFSEVGGLTSGSIVFASSTGSLWQSNTGFFWNNALSRLGIGTLSPASAVSIQSFSGIAMLEVGDYSTNNSITKVIIKNRWTGNDSASLVVQGTNVNANHFYVGGGGNSAFGTTSANLTSRLSVWGSGNTSATNNFRAINSASTTLFNIDNAGGIYALGNVGIGTTTPSAVLTVAGTANITGTTTLATTSLTATLQDITGSAGTSGQVLSSTGTSTQWITNAAGSGTVLSGTTGQFPYYAGAGTTLTATSTLFLTISGLLGIGTTTPATALSVIGTTTTTGLSVGSGLTSGVITSTGANSLILQTGSSTTGSITMPAGANQDFTIAPNGNGSLIITKNINTTSDRNTFSQKVQINGSSLVLANASNIDWGSGNVTLTHSTGLLTASKAFTVLGTTTLATTTISTSTIGTLNVTATTTTTGVRLTGFPGVARAVFTNATNDLVASGDSLALATALTDETGTGVAVFGTSPTFTTNLTSPGIIGGTGVASTLTLKSTTGAGTSDAMIFLVGNNGSNEGGRFNTNGTFNLGTTTATGTVLGISVASSTAGRVQSLPFGEMIQMVIAGVNVIVETWDYYGHKIFGGSAPALTACGTSPTIVGNDMVGTITVGTTATGCTMTFNKAWNQAPVCVYSNQNMSITSALTYTETATALTFSQAAGFSSNVVNYHCFGRQ
jgi:hypothetical protein